eukprot:c22051_g1_i1.p1 GENE.c22051_g1_i1~~c22051_g1_i1.p1  ORF type:complete len:217 (+),score=50.31 c22051_g1_i1:55-651(+)
MKLSNSLLVVCLLAFQLVLVAGIELTLENFDSEIARHDTTTLVRFTNHGCTECRESEVDWEKLQADFSDNPHLVFGDLDCSNDRMLCSRLAVRTFPSFKYFSAQTGDVGKRYSGSRHLSALREFVQTYLLPLVPSCEIDKEHTCSEDELNYLRSAPKTYEGLMSQMHDLIGSNDDEAQKHRNILSQLIANWGRVRDEL